MHEIAVAFLIVLVVAALLFLAWRAQRGKRREPRREPPAGPPLRHYPEADRTRILQHIEALQAELRSRRPAAGWIDERRFYAEQIDEIATAARNGSFVPAQYAGAGFGRGADELFGDGALVTRAYSVQAFITELASRPPLPGPVSGLR